MKAEIIEGLSFRDYQTIPTLNMSLLSEILESPGKLDWRRTNPKKVTPAMIAGGAIDCLALEPNLFPRQYITAPMRPEELPDHFIAAPPGYSTKKADKIWKAEQEGAGMVIHKPSDWSGGGLGLTTTAGKAWKAWATAKGLRVLNQTQLTEIRGAAESVLSYGPAAEIIGPALKQVTLVWQDPDTGIWCKGRPDLYLPKTASRGPVVPDLKSTGLLAGPESAAKLCYNSGWHRQSAYYCNGLQAITGEPHDTAQIIVVEQDPPHRPEVYELPPSILEQGRAEVRSMIEKYAYWQDRGEWPLSSGQVLTLEFAPWMTR